jgi:hypothetical protein
MATYNLSWPAQGTDQDQVKDLIVTSFGPTATSSHGNIQLVLARPKNSSKSSKGPRRHFLQANETSSHGNIPLVLARQETDQDQVKGLVINFFRPTMTFLHGSM